MRKQFYLATMAIFCISMSANLKTQAQCTAISSITPGAITCSTAAFSWTPVPGAMGYEYVVDMLMTDPTAMGGMAMSPTASATGLSASTTYNVHMRTWCSMSSYSTWTIAGTITTPTCVTCNAPTTVTATPAPHSVHLSWPSVTGAMNYEYVVNTSMTDPTSAGTSTTSNSVTVTGLSPLTSYYVHTRTQCGASTWSPWSAAHSFSTASAAGVNNVNNGGFAINSYPNPFQNVFTIEVNGGNTDNAALQISDVNGRILKTVKLTEDITTLSLNNLAAGLYFVKYSDGENTRTIKVTKE